MINQNGAKCVHVRSVDGDSFKLVTDNGNESFSAWFATIDGELPDIDSFIDIEEFEFTAIPKNGKFPVRLTVRKWSYYFK